MKVVLDANRFFCALLKDGPTRRAIYDTEAALFAPEFLKSELANHRDELQRRSRLTAADFSRLVEEIAKPDRMGPGRRHPSPSARGHAGAWRGGHR